MVVKKSGLTTNELGIVYNNIKMKITVIPESYLKTNLERARSLIGARDPSDVPFLAVAMFPGLDGIWSNDKDFTEQDVVRVWKTSELLEILISIEERKEI